MSQIEVDYDLLDRAKNGDDVALGKAYEEHKLLIHALLKRYHYKLEDKEDIFQMGSMGLIKAIQNFDSTYGVRFSTYAVPLILGEIRKYFRESGMLKVSRSIRDLLSEIKKTEEKIRKTSMCEPRIEQIAEALGVSVEEIIIAYESNYTPSSLSEPICDTDETMLLEDVIASQDLGLDIEKLDLNNALSLLEQKEQIFVQMRFYQGLNQSEIAERLFISQVQVSRIEKKIIAKIKSSLVK